LLQNDFIEKDIEIIAQQHKYFVHKDEKEKEERKTEEQQQQIYQRIPFPILFSSCDSFGRNLLHQACIFGNISLMKYLISKLGKDCLNMKDKYDITCAHIAGKNK